MKRKHKINIIRIVIAAAGLVILNVIPVTDTGRLIAFAAVYLVIGYDILIKAGRGIVHGRVFDENFLMTAATIGAFALAVYDRSGDYNEAVAVMLFYQTGELFQSLAVEKSRRNISELMDLRPDYANVETDGVLEKRDPDEVPAGSVIVVQPGEKIPLDGMVIEGESSINTSALTGESIPVDVTAGMETVSGCINMTGVLKIRTTKEFEESTVSRILELIQESGSRKSHSEQFISRFARVYTPAVCILALALALLPPAVRLIAGLGPEWSVWIYRALTFLVISCPCALVVSIPLTFFAGIGGAGRKGILIKGSNYLEMLAGLKTAVFDKTGTLTKGVFEVTNIHHNTIPDQKLIEYAALAECASSHPAGASLVRAYGKEPDRNRVTDIREISGKGVTARVDNRRIAAGNERLMEELGISPKGCHSPGTIIHIAIDGEYAGHIVISDVEKPDAARAIRELKELGIKKTVILTGDRKNAAEKTALDLGIDEVYYGLLPEEKVSRVEELSTDGLLAFTGDGINDAPVLTRADIGVAMGAMGSDAAIEAADVVLMDDNPMKLVLAVKISRKVMRIVYQNIVFALAVKFLCLLLGALGISNMWYAIFADVGVMVIAVLNAIRAIIL